jgi:hypothetical protein
MGEYAAYRVPMSVARQLIVPAAPAAVRAPYDGQVRMFYFRNDGTGPVYLGDETVTAGDGFELAGNTMIGPVAVAVGEELHGIRASGASVVHVWPQATYWQGGK